jgi:glyoxylase-like metal-dependent hydrolase (beta-lactamase superfamily II)
MNSYRSADLPSGMKVIIRDWDTRALLLDFAGQRCEPFAIDHTIKAGETLRLAGIDWQVIAAPGHDMGSLVFYSPTTRILISADALWARPSGSDPTSFRRGSDPEA